MLPWAVEGVAQSSASLLQCPSRLLCQGLGRLFCKAQAVIFPAPCPCGPITPFFHCSLKAVMGNTT